ncbi:dynamin family protein [Actibacterium ureilyticum]|uniref:dynamin family protein n=1 Tax=Actibacterium ureilyticum TaxID=1590614 RepID=UPI000BAAE59F|nr:dynamin family protein [Actibacterium ureilyticum]
MKIAPKQRQELDFLRDTLENLEKFAGRDTRQNFRDLRERLDNWAARVAVIGQVKAGKSTFLNAFLHQHDFLPSDVNPWTSVVTNIRINVPTDPISGARFEFFDDSDWEEIVNGGSKIRKLTEQLLPGFDTEVLRQQSAEMRDRAERRLGKHFKTLLGTHHDYDFLSPDLLKRYVCAGPGSHDGLARESLGRYAALTKVANVYMRLPEFQVPTILTDTPGVNDPFLVRDEFTCRSLDHSDAFIVVLSAHQPLTDVDVALIRILAKQDSKEVMIFVNRIDELDNYSVELPRVMSDVENRLKAAIPDIDFTLLAGSGYMADLAMRTDPESEAEIRELDSPELHRFLEATYRQVPEDPRDRLILASGLHEVKSALSTLIDEGLGSRHLDQFRSDIRAELNAVQFVTKRERDSLQQQVESVNSEVAAMVVEEMESEIADIQSVQANLESNLENANQQIEKVLNKYWSKLEAKLVFHIETFVDEQKPVFEERVFRSNVTGSNGNTLDISTLPLQGRMEKEVVQSYAKSRASIDVPLSNCIEACRQEIKEHFDDALENISLDDLPFDGFNSTLTLAKQTLRVDLVSGRGWAFWRQKSIDVDKSIAALRSIAALELRPPIEKILSAYNEAQVERASAGLARIQTMLRMVEVGLTERTHRLKQTKAEFEQIAKDPQMQQRMVYRIQSQMEVLERRLLNLSAMDSAIARSDMLDAKVA